jgi:hypothetical protein
MNLITRYKKVVLSAMVVAAISIGGQMIAACSPCAAAAAARKSVAEAIAAALAAGKPAARELELDLSVSEDLSRAPREPIADECNTCDTCDTCEAICSSPENCDCAGILNFIACQVQRQGRDARKC